jgi:curved DNA-binding protein CbpA
MQNIKDLEAVARVLGLAPDATLEQVRAAYLAKVQQFPPDREPEKFAEIHQAYQWLSDPLAFAEALIHSGTEPPDLEAIVDAAQAQPPRLTPAQLLSLGNLNP